MEEEYILILLFSACQVGSHLTAMSRQKGSGSDAWQMCCLRLNPSEPHLMPIIRTYSTSPAEILSVFLPYMQRLQTQTWPFISTISDKVVILSITDQSDVIFSL